MGDQIAILVVEDEPLVRMVSADQLRTERFVVFEAADADAAIRLLAANSNIRVLFTDIDMPGSSMDGLKLSAYAKGRWPPLQIIVASGHRAVDVVDLPDGGVFYSKPYKMAEIVRSVRALLTTPSHSATA